MAVKNVDKGKSNGTMTAKQSLSSFASTKRKKTVKNSFEPKSNRISTTKR